MSMTDGPPKSPAVTSANPGWPLSMVKGMDGPIIWSNGPRKKYDPGVLSTLGAKC